MGVTRSPGDAVVDRDEAAQQQRGRRGRDGQGPVGGLHTAGPERQRADGPARGAAMHDDVGGRDDVGDRIPGPDLVERHRLDADAVDLGLGLRQPLEDRDRGIAHRRLERGGTDVAADVRPGPMAMRAVRRLGMMVVVVAVMVVVIVMVAVRVRVGGRRAVERHQEAAPLQHAVVVRHEVAANRRHGRHGGEHAGLKVGEGVEQRGGEHVAGHAADGIELNVHGRRRAPLM